MPSASATEPSPRSALTPPVQCRASRSKGFLRRTRSCHWCSACLINWNEQGVVDGFGGHSIAVTLQGGSGRVDGEIVCNEPEWSLCRWEFDCDHDPEFPGEMRRDEQGWMHTYTEDTDAGLIDSDCRMKRRTPGECNIKDSLADPQIVMEDIDGIPAAGLELARLRVEPRFNGDWYEFKYLGVDE